MASRPSSDSATVVGDHTAVNKDEGRLGEKAGKERAGSDVDVRLQEGRDVETLRQIETKKLSWQQATFLLMGEYIVIAILSFPSSYSVLGMAGGILTTIFVALCTLWTSHILWRYCMAHPETTDITTLGRDLFGGSRLALELTTLGLVLNNLFIMALHIVSGGIALNTLSNNSVCTLVWTGAVMLVVMFTGSLFRELKHVASMSIFAAVTMFIALIMTLAFAGSESTPVGYDPARPVTIRAWAAPGTTFVAGLSAALNISYTFIGQILIPSFVQDMAHPEDFPKALYAVTAAEVVLFSLSGGVLYWKFGSEYIDETLSSRLTPCSVTSPAYGSLQRVYAKAVAGMTLPTLVVVYSVVTSRILFTRVMGGPNSVHVQRVTKKGTIVWVAIVATTWILSFIIGESIPFFNDLLSLMASLFDCWFGFIFWGVAFWSLYGRRGVKGVWRTIEAVFSTSMIGLGLFVLGAGTYVSVRAGSGFSLTAQVQSIRMSYASGTVAGAWSCESTGF